MKFVFWSCFLLVNYIYWGYPALLALMARLRPKPILERPIRPTVSVILAVRNESARLPAKLKNIEALRYPKNLLEVIVVSDGSTDETAEILRQHGSWVRSIVLEEPVGKAMAVNRAVDRAQGEILVFFDVRQYVHPDAIEELVGCFADPGVGGVSGELQLMSATGGSAASEGMRLYWRIEKMIRRLESASGSVIGVTGAIYALRRSLFEDIPRGTLLDDVLIPMRAARAGWRIVFQPKAIADDVVFNEAGKEFSRKVRTLSGNYQILRLAPWLLTPQNPLLFRFVCHKVLRLLVPFFLILMLVSCALAGSPPYTVLFGMQVLFYGLAAMGTFKAMRRFRLVSAAYTLLSLNFAALIAFRNFVLQNHDVWQAS